VPRVGLLVKPQATPGRPLSTGLPKMWIAWGPDRNVPKAPLPCEQNLPHEVASALNNRRHGVSPGLSSVDKKSTPFPAVPTNPTLDATRLQQAVKPHVDAETDNKMGSGRQLCRAAG
jgi:hypothetical protein